jgi:hypothetical protein
MCLLCLALWHQERLAGRDLGCPNQVLNGCYSDYDDVMCLGDDLTEGQCIDHFCYTEPEANGHPGHNDLYDTCSAACINYDTGDSYCDADCWESGDDVFCNDYYVYCDCLEIEGK